MILLTGGAGFIGSHIAKLLTARNLAYVILDNLSTSNRDIVSRISSSPLLITGDIGDSELVRSILDGSHDLMKGRQVSFVVHLAASAYVGESIANPQKYYKNNLSKAFTLIDSIVAENYARSNSGQKSSYQMIRILFSSSCATYGLPVYLPIDEEHLQVPINPYGRSKLFLEHYIKDLSNACGLSGIILRYFNASGSDPEGTIGEYHNPETHLIPLALQATTIPGKPLKIFGTDYKTSDGTCVRDFVHVLDIASAHLLALTRLEQTVSASTTHGHIECFNLGTGTGYSVLDVIRSVEYATGLIVPAVSEQRRKGDPPILVASYVKAQELLGWKPEYTDIDDIVAHAWHWYKLLPTLGL